MLKLIFPCSNTHNKSLWLWPLSRYPKFVFQKFSELEFIHLLPTIISIARQAQPYFEKRPTSVVASRHQPFVWECHIRGVPEPVVQWYHNGQAIIYDQNRVKLASGSLHFISVLEQYNGSYVCEGSNTLGKISSQPVAFVVACK